MGESEEVVYGEGMDLYTEEMDDEDRVDSADSYTLVASEDGTSWASIGESMGDLSSDLSTGGPGRARHVRIDVPTGHAEIDAVMAL